MDMVATTMTWSAATRWLVAGMALAFYAAMIATGALPTYGNFNTAALTGLMTEPPEAVTQVVLRSSTHTFQFNHTDGQWQLKGSGTTMAENAQALQQAIQFIHTAAPVRELNDTTNDATFGLQPPQYTITLNNTAGSLLNAEMGRKNPDGVLRYLRVNGEQSVYLMSGFGGEAWDKVLTAATSASRTQNGR